MSARPHEPPPGFSAGVQGFWQGLGLLVLPGVRAWALGPVLLAALLLGLAAWFGIHALDAALDTWLADQWDFLRWLIWPIAVAITLLISNLALVVLAGIFGVAFLDRLSVAVESHLGARPPALDEAPWWQSLVPTLAQEWRKLRYFGWLILLLVLSLLIPGLNALSPLLWCLGGAWMLALELLDGVFSRHGHPFPAALRCLRQHRACAFGFGLTAVVLSVLPLLNCLALPAGVAGATLLFHRHFGNRGY
ncbi:MAG: EI24 domain-containing protein [Gammaproteobacteria bacterium]|nr:EI24 domain-containing protein [Gammaproteobacteria bacterium]